MKGVLAAFEAAIALGLAIERIKKLIFTLLGFLALSLAAVAQTTQVPTVTLSGPVADPTLENHSGKAVIAARGEFYCRRWNTMATTAPLHP